MDSILLNVHSFSPFILLVLGILIQWLASSHKVFSFLYIVSGIMIIMSIFHILPLLLNFSITSSINTIILLSIGGGIINYYIFGKASSIVLPFAFAFISSAILIIIYKDILLIDNRILRIFPYILALSFFIVFFIMALPDKKRRKK